MNEGPEDPGADDLSDQPAHVDTAEDKRSQCIWHDFS
jgi:hypothetical protein